MYNPPPASDWYQQALSFPSALTGATTTAGAGIPVTASSLNFGMSSPLDVSGLTGGVGGLGVPGIGVPKTGLFGGMGGMDIANLALSGLGTLGNLWSGFESRDLAKKQFKFSKEFAEKNMANQIATYNTTLEDRARSRAAVEDQSNTDRDAYINKNRLTG